MTMAASHAVAARDASRLAFLMLVAGAVAIAFAPILVRISEVGPVATAFWRMSLAMPGLVVIAILQPPARSPAAGDAPGRKTRPTTLREAGHLLLCGAFFAGDLACWHVSIALTSVANATLLANFAPIFVTLASWALFGERFPWRFVVGLAIAMAGACLLMANSLTLGAENLVGDALGLLTAVFYGGYILSIGRLRATFTTATVMVWSSAATALLLLPLALLFDAALVPVTLVGWVTVLALAYVSHVGGQGLIAYALAHLPAALGSLSLLIQPVAAAVLAWLLLGEALVAIQALGGVVVLIGILVARAAVIAQRANAERPSSGASP